jgi:hypothetical protein
MDWIFNKKILNNNFNEKNNINFYNESLIFKKSNIKKVKFNNTIKVMLIPNREEYLKNSLNNLLWWKEEDYCEFKLNILKIDNNK